MSEAQGQACALNRPGRKAPLREEDSVFVGGKLLKIL